MKKESAQGFLEYPVGAFAEEIGLNIKGVAFHGQKYHRRLLVYLIYKSYCQNSGRSSAFHDKFP